MARGPLHNSLNKILMRLSTEAGLYEARRTESMHGLRDIAGSYALKPTVR